MRLAHLPRQLRQVLARFGLVREEPGFLPRPGGLHVGQLPVLHRSPQQDVGVIHRHPLRLVGGHGIAQLDLMVVFQVDPHPLPIVQAGPETGAEEAPLDLRHGAQRTVFDPIKQGIAGEQHPVPLADGLVVE